MKFKVINEEKENLLLSSGDLFDILSSKVNINEPKNEFEILNLNLYNSLEKAQIITPMINKNILMNVLYICFCIGYYYRIFLEKNKVELIKEETNNDKTDS